MRNLLMFVAVAALALTAVPESKARCPIVGAVGRVALAPVRVTARVVAAPVRLAGRIAFGPAACQTQQATIVVPSQAQPANPSPQTSATTSDPSGFVAALNQTRASLGLNPVGYDPNLESWAAQNNAQQHARGMGHHVMGPARRQNSAMGGYASILPMWMQSAPHRSALLDPSITAVGLAGSGSYWTFNAY